jgi:hypothetical protein
MIGRLKLRRWDISDRLEKSAVIKPVHPFQRGELDGFNVPPRTASVDQFRLVETDDRLGERVVVGIANATYRRLDPSFGQTLGVANRKVLGEFNPSLQHSLNRRLRWVRGSGGRVGLRVQR